MHFYRQSIILFGIVIPMLVAAVIIGGGAVVKSKIQSSFNTKLASYKNYERDRLAGLDIETQVNRQREHLDRWNEELAQEAASAVRSNLTDIMDHLPSKEIEEISFDPSATSGGFGLAVAQKSAQIRIGFRGTYRTLQRNFLELETRMPQLQLQEIKLDPVVTQSSQLTCQVTYTAWEL